MKRVDCNCFVGTWPFHYVRGSRFEDLLALHADNQIDYGYVSSTEAIFYNDPYEADCQLAVTLRGSKYQHVVTVNPMLPGCCDSLRRMAREFPVAGVRILPGFHDYTLQDPALDTLYEVLCELQLPLFLTVRMEDERVIYMFRPKEIPVWDMDMFVSTHTEVPIVLCNCRNSEITFMSGTIKARPHVSFDCSGLKNGLFSMDEFEQQGLTSSMVYGSLAPIFCMKSTILLVETAEMSNERKESIYAGTHFIDQVRQKEAVI